MIIRLNLLAHSPSLTFAPISSRPRTMSDVPRTIVIIGGGIVGCTTAYYLTHHPYYSRANTTAILLEASASGPAKGASGKAGGLVA